MTDVASANAGGGHAYGILTGNFMGTGRTDIIRWSDTPSKNQLWVSNGDGSFGGSTFTANASFNITGASQYLGKSDGCFGAIVADFNSDGLADILEFENQTNNAGAACYSGSPTNTLYINMGGGVFHTNTVSNVSFAQKKTTLGSTGCLSNGIKLQVPAYGAGSNFYLIDVNGDGILDVVQTALTGGYIKSACFPGGLHGTTNVYLGSSGSGGVFSFAATSTNLASTTVYSDPPSLLYSSIPTVDVNGDGYTDLILTQSEIWGGLTYDSGQTYLSNGDGNFTLVSDSLASGSPFCTQSIDVNGDGKPDCLYAGSSGNGLRIENDTASLPFDANFNLSSNTLAPASGAVPNVGVVVADFDDDGRSDLLVWNDTPTSNALYLSNGDGSFATGATNLTGWPLRKSDGSYDFALGDFTGHGTPELLVVNATSGTSWGSRLLVKADWSPPDQLVSVTSPTGLVTKLNWVPLASSKDSGGVAHYTPDAGTPNASTNPTADLSPAVWMVASSVSDTGVGSSGGVLYDTTSYFYTGLKADLQGRGALGFRQVARTNPGSDGTSLTVTTNYVQSYPFIGLAANTATTVASTGAVLSQTWNQYGDMTSTVALPPVSASEVVGTALPACASSTALVKQPYLLASYESGKDLNGAVLPDSLTTNVYGLENGHLNMGDPTSVVTVTGGNTSGGGGALNQSFTKTVTNTYLTADSSGGNWVLGRLTNSTVKNVVSAASALTAAAGTGSNATAVAGTATAMSVLVAAPGTATAAVQTGTAISTTPVPINFAGYPTAPISYTVTRVSTGTTDITSAVNTSVTPATVTFTSTVLAPGQSATETFQVQAVDAAGRTGATGSGGSSANVVVTIGNSVSTTATFTGVTGTGAGSSTISASGSNLTGSVWENNGTLANVYTLSFRNDGNAVMTLTGLAFTGTISTVFSVGTNTCTAIAVGASCTIGVTVNSNVTFGGYSGTWATLGANTNAGGAVTETIYAVVAQWGSSAAAQTLSFGSQTAGTSSAAQNVTLHNLGNASAAWTALANLPAGFSATLTGCASVAAGGSCTVSVTFTPTAAAAYGGTNNIAPSPAATINNNYLTVTGTGVRKVVAIPAITSNTANYTLNPSKVTGYVAGYTDVTLTIASGVYVYSTSTATAALTVSGFAAGDTVTLAGGGNIYGAGGAGGAGATTTNQTGSGGLVGGDAISLSYGISFSGFSGVVAGGGGGGGGGGGSSTFVKIGQYINVAGTGGGGGAGYSGGVGGSGASGVGSSAASPSTSGGKGGSSSAATGGNGGAAGSVGANGANSATTNTAGGAGGGGGLGASGGSGGKGDGLSVSGLGGSGGAAGYAVRKNGQTVAGTLPTHYGLIQ
jgi:hypothetical protein